MSTLAWRMGYEACYDGLGYSENNPFDEDDNLQEYCEWNAGWSTAYREMMEMEEAEDVIGSFDE